VVRKVYRRLGGTREGEGTAVGAGVYNFFYGKGNENHQRGKVFFKTIE